ncbi:MAG: DUF1501 domain-containing protein [Chlorobi bacterium]|nr:DUF1501 domain-containing protein [Chlorobiota bacterium]
MKRRTFIQRLGATGIVLPLAMGFPRVRAFAKPPANSHFMGLLGATNDNVMVLIRLAGGNDGLNTIVPYTDSTYYNARAGDSLGIAEKDVIKLPDSAALGLHPSLQPLAELYTEKKFAIVQSVGYPNQNLSHFRSTDIWLSGSDWNVYDNAGWYGKYLEKAYPDYPGVLPSDPFAIELGTYLSTTLIGEQNNMGVAVSDLSYIPGQPDSDPVRGTHAGDEEAYVREIARQSNVFSNAILNAAGKQLTNKVTYPTGNVLGTALASIARLIAAGLKTQMYIVNIGGYDTHGNQLDTQATLHKTFADAVKAFQRDIEGFGLDKRVCTMTVSEFGRRVASNGGGTDHGSAAPLFVIGTNVNGGLFGNAPNLTDLEGPGNIKMQFDFRQIYASVLGQWYAAPEEMIQPGPLPRHFDQLPIFKVSSNPTGVDYANEAAAGMTLGQNYPNPASNGTTFPIGGVPSGVAARLAIHTLEGREVFAQDIPAGQSSIYFDTRVLAPGSYITTLTAGTARRTRSMTVVR